MINTIIMAKAILAYKKVFPKWWKNEKFKWEAVKEFQDNWDIDAADFASMLSMSLSKTNGLLASANNYPAGMIKEFAKAYPEDVRAMFLHLFDENAEVYDRIDSFKTDADMLLEKYGHNAKQHYQYENAISTYLWLRYPDKYYIYKYGEAREVSKKLQSDYPIKKGAFADNIRNFLRLYNEVASELQKDQELKALLSENLSLECYPDPELRTLTIDVCFFISRDFNDAVSDDSEWYPSESEYNPGFTKENWLAMLYDPQVISVTDKSVLAAFYAEGGAATCSQIARKHHKNAFGISGVCTTMAKRIAKETKCPVMLVDDNSKYWPILFTGKKADPEEPGVWVWKLRPELYDACTEFGILKHLWKDETTMASIEKQPQNYWWLNANPKIWSFASMAVGEEQNYTLYNENGNKRRIFQNFLDAKEGDLVIGYESNPVKQIVGIATVSKEQDGESLYFRKVEGLSTPIDYQTLKACQELTNMEYFVNPQGSLFKLTKDECEFIMDIIREENPLEEKAKIEPYTKANFLEDVFMTENQYETLAAILKKKKNIILQGAPGVGKTYAATRLAYAMMGEKDDSRIELIQFHQNYSYEDFMMGYKPAGEGFELKYGVFYRFCQKAANQPKKDFFFIIDEINRGNMSKIFGELLMSIEKDYRNKPITLAYTGMSFSVPDNLHIIGMMNTADRSLAMIDYALRRRFSFFAMEPGFDTEGFLKKQKAWGSDTLDALLEQVRELNRRIIADKSLGKGFCIGHSYFCGLDGCSDTELRAIVEYDILPMLSEYWFDEPTKLQEWENRLRGVFQK